MTVSYWLDAHKKKETREVDVAIIGGGIMGATAAYWLSKRSGIKTAMLDARRPGWGASGRNGGFVLRGIVAYYNQAVELYGRDRARWIFKFNEETLAHLAEFAKTHGERFHYNNCGSYLLACSLDELQHLQASAQLMHEDGFEVEYLKQDPIDRDYYGGLFNRCDVGVHSGLLVDTLIEASGTELFTNSEVYRIEHTDEGKVLLKAAGVNVLAENVLLVTNAYAALMDPLFAKNLRPVRGQVIVTKPLKKRVLENLCYANFGYEYFRQLPDDRFLLGGCREPFAADEVGFADTLTQPVQMALHNYIRDRFPEAAGVPIDYAWSGVMAFTADGLPMMGTLQPRVHYAVGCNGHGMGWSFALSRLLVEYALDGAECGIFAAGRVQSNAVGAQQ